MSKQSSNDSWQFTKEGVFELFPAGFRVLIVDDDRVCLIILEQMLKSCFYQVTKTSRAKDALSILREKTNEFDIVISNVHMPEMDGFTLLNHVAREINLPVILTSAADEKELVMEGVTHGACDYIIKPVRREELTCIWKHVVRRRDNEFMRFQQFVAKEGKRRRRSSNDHSEFSSESSTKNKGKEIETREKDDSKKMRVVWSVELHQQFVQAVNHLGLEKAVPKKILELMKVPQLTRENIASHLQKYRQFLRKCGECSRVPRSPNALILDTKERKVGSVPLQNLDTIFRAGQTSAHEISTSFGRSIARSGLRQTNQRDEFFSFKKFEQEEEKKRTNLLHGIPTSMEPSQFASIYQSMKQPMRRANMQANPSLSQSRGGILMQATQQLSSRPRIMERGSSSTNPFSWPHHVLAHHRYNNPAPLTNQSSSNSFLFGSSSRISTLAPNGLVRNGINAVPTSDILNQHKSQERSSQIPILDYQGFISVGQNMNSSIGGLVNAPNVGQQLNTTHVDNPVSVKAEQPIYQNMIYLDHHDQEDLMSVLDKHERTGELEDEFGFTGYSLDDFPMYF